MSVREIGSPITNGHFFDSPGRKNMFDGSVCQSESFMFKKLPNKTMKKSKSVGPSDGRPLLKILFC